MTALLSSSDTSVSFPSTYLASQPCHHGHVATDPSLSRTSEKSASRKLVNREYVVSVSQSVCLKKGGLLKPPSKLLRCRQGLCSRKLECLETHQQSTDRPSCWRGAGA